MVRIGPKNAMANHKSAIKRIRQNERRSDINTRNRGALRSSVKALHTTLEGEAPKDAANLLAPTVSSIDKAVQKGIIKKNKADRMKSRLTKRVNAAAKADA